MIVWSVGSTGPSEKGILMKTISNLGLVGIAIAVSCSFLPLPVAADSRPVDIWSDSTRLSGDLWLPDDLAADEKRAAIVLAQGWGGLRAELNDSYAPIFESYGFIVLTFDYRGWGGSDGRLTTSEPIPTPDPDGTAIVRVREIRKVIDPQEQVEDLLNAVAFVMGEPHVRADRIGLWGTSYGGGHVIEAAAREPRVAAVVAQVGFMGVARTTERIELGKKRMVQKARGEIDGSAMGVDELAGGWPDFAKMVQHRPLENAHRVIAATLILDAKDDQYFDSAANGRAVYEIIGQHAPAGYKLFPGDHYTVYGPHRAEAIEQAIDWFRAHLN